MKDRNDLIRNIIARARNDMAAARLLIEAGAQSPDVICFHCQQAAEKYLKAWLHFRQVDVPRTHNLQELLSLCEPTDTGFHTLTNASELSYYAVEVRYAEDFYMPSADEAKRAVDIAASIETFITGKLHASGFAL